MNSSIEKKMKNLNGNELRIQILMAFQSNVSDINSIKKYAKDTTNGVLSESQQRAIMSYCYANDTYMIFCGFSELRSSNLNKFGCDLKIW